jgi:hypothetical protein
MITNKLSAILSAVPKTGGSLFLIKKGKSKKPGVITI